MAIAAFWVAYHYAVQGAHALSIMVEEGLGWARDWPARRRALAARPFVGFSGGVLRPSARRATTPASRASSNLCVVCINFFCVLLVACEPRPPRGPGPNARPSPGPRGRA